MSAKPTAAELERDVRVLRRRHREMMARDDYFRDVDLQAEAAQLFEDIAVLEKGADEADLGLELSGDVRALRERQASAEASARALVGRNDYDTSTQAQGEAERLFRTAAAYGERVDLHEAAAAAAGGDGNDDD